MKEQVSFNSEFCHFLENHLTLFFSKAKEKQIRSLWCDDILMPGNEIQVTKKSVNDTRRIITKAWIGIGTRSDVQFDLIIHFGKYSLRRYAKENKLDDCIPPLESSQHINIDIENTLIELHLL